MSLNHPNVTPHGHHPKTGQYVGAGSMGDGSIHERPTGLKTGETMSSTQASVAARKPDGSKSA